jgi:hypothetical protein
VLAGTQTMVRQNQTCCPFNAELECKKRGRPGAPVKQTIEVGVTAPADKTQTGYIRERQAWRERHGIERQTPATCFATPSFFVCGTGAPGRPLFL